MILQDGVDPAARDKVSLETGLECKDKSLAVQSQKDEADINVIVKRFGLTGELPVNQRIPLNVDVEDLMDYRECLDIVLKAKASFGSLPAHVRSTFDNDAAAFADYAVDPANLEQMRAWGLAPPAPPAPVAPAGGAPA